jgi:hypothetical protein
LIVGIEEHHNFIQLFGQMITQKPKYRFFEAFPEAFRSLSPDVA